MKSPRGEGYSLYCSMRGGSNRKGYMTFFRPQVYERVGISLFKVYMKGKMSFRFVKKGPKELPDAFFDCEKVKKTFWCAWYIHVLRTMHLPQSVKRDRCKVLDKVCERGATCQYKVYERRTCSVENVYKRLMGWT